MTIPSSRSLLSWISVFSGGGGGAGGERRGLGPRPRNDVLTTCKAIILRDGQRIIAAFSHSGYIFRGNQKCLKNSFIFVFLAYCICLSVLKLLGKLNTTALDLNRQQRARSMYRLNRFCWARIT